MFALFICCALTYIHAQEYLPSDSTNPYATKYSRNDRVLVIPFEYIMYNSEIDRSINSVTDYTSKEIRMHMQMQLVHHVAEALMEHGYHPTEMFGEPFDEDLDYIYSSISYSYEEVPSEKEDKKASIGNVFRKIKNTVEGNEKVMGQGQVRDAALIKDEYFATTIKDKNMVQEICKKYNVDYLFFINELDIFVSQNSNVQQYEQHTYQRTAKMHFTMINRKGGRVKSSAVRYNFANQVNDPKEIGLMCFINLGRLAAKNIRGGAEITGDIKEELALQPRSKTETQEASIQEPIKNSTKENKKEKSTLKQVLKPEKSIVVKKDEEEYWDDY